MKKRTNNHNDFFDYLIIFIIPIILTVFVFSTGVEESFEKILNAGSFLMTLQQNEKTDDTVKTDNINEFAVSDNVTDNKVNSSFLSIPDDVLSLMKKAEKTYAKSSNDGKIIEKGTMCKMARGEMVRYMAEHQIKDPGRIRSFDRLDYCFDEMRSDDNKFVFIRNATNS